MKFYKLEIKNWKSFYDLSFEFGSGNILIWGDSRVGKTSLLKVIAAFMTRFRDGFIELDDGIYVTDNDASFIKELPNFREYSLKGTFLFDEAINVDYEYDIESPGHFIQILECKDNHIHMLSEAEIENLDSVEAYITKVRRTHENLPVLQFYTSDRNILNKCNCDLKYLTDFEAIYYSGLSQQTNLKFFCEWIGLKKNIGVAEDYLININVGLKYLFPDFKSELMLNEQNNLVIKYKDFVYDYTQFSNYEKSCICMFADLMLRLILANPKSDNPFDGMGVVLIDNVDLFMDNSVQQGFVDRLNKLFPNVQFIMTVNNYPQICSDLSDNNDLFKLYKISKRIVRPINNSETIELRVKSSDLMYMKSGILTLD